MKQRFRNRNKRRLAVVSAVLLLSGLVALMTPHLRSRAASPAAKGSTGIVYQSRLPYYDIRQEKEGVLIADLYRQQQERSNLSGLRAGIKMGEASLGTRVPNLALEYTNALNTPELVGRRSAPTARRAGPATGARRRWSPSGPGGSWR